jgi:dipeptidyl aminopeptidase/acylaminoacyl peptidase
VIFLRIRMEQSLPQTLLDLIDAPKLPIVSLSPDRRWLLVAQPSGLPPIADLARRELRLAGLRLDPLSWGRSRGGHYTTLSLLEIDGGRERQVEGFPRGAKIAAAVWSPDAAHLACYVQEERGCTLWLVEVAAAQARQLSHDRLNAAASTPFQWHPDGHSLVCRFVPPAQQPMPEPGPNLTPVAQENVGRRAPGRTFQDLLKNEQDAALFDHYLTSQLARVDLEGRVAPLSQPGIFTASDPSPDGNWLLVETLRRPYSYTVPASRFPRRVEVWPQGGTPQGGTPWRRQDAAEGRAMRASSPTSTAAPNGTLTPARLVADLPLADDVGVAMDCVRRGPRQVHWRADAPCELAWVEAQDEGDAEKDAEVRDRLFQLNVGAEGAPRPTADLSMRFAGVTWGDGELALLRERWWKTRRERLWRLRPDRAGAAPELLLDRSFEDRYGDPGMPLTERNRAGERVLVRGPGDCVYLAGGGDSPKGSRPFLDRFDLGTRQTTRLWQCEFPYYEAAVAFLDDARTLLVTQQESLDAPPNCLVRDLSRGTARPLTRFPHPTPQLKEARRELLRYKRADGLLCTARLHTPPGWTENDGPLPTLVWAYPREFKSAELAGQLTDSPHRFARVFPYSPLLWLTQGYAVLEGPTLAIVGQREKEPNDTYIEQLVAGAQAAVDEVVRRGVADPKRIAVGGHSYGAAMAASLLAHCDLFCAGIAQSGAYNRTLTPFGFQYEERTLWQSPESYARLSPFCHADKIRRPLLLIHGQADENAGTYPMQSERFFQALKGLGKTTRLVLLPHEGHGYEARESIVTVVSEVFAWLEKHVRGRTET